MLTNADHRHHRGHEVEHSRRFGRVGHYRTNRSGIRWGVLGVRGTMAIRALGLREGWRGDGLEALCPLDAELNLPPTLDSHGVRRRVAELAS